MKRIMHFSAALICLAALLAVAVYAEGGSAVNEIRSADGGYSGSCSAAYGETVTCRAVVAAEDIMESGGMLHGAISPSLRFLGLLNLTYSDEAINSAFYTLAVGDREDGCSFEIHFSADFCETLAPGKTVEAEYTVCMEDGQCAECRVYAAGKGEAAEIHAYSVTLFRGVCAVGENDRRHPLYGALYEMYTSDGERVRFFRETDGTYSVCTAPDCAHGHHVSILRTPENGTLSLRGLSAGKYVLEEKRPPAGYSAAGERAEWEIAESGELLTGDTPREGETLLFLNHSSAILPTAPEESDLLRFYTVGCRVLAALAALIFTDRALLRKNE